MGSKNPGKYSGDDDGINIEVKIVLEKSRQRPMSSHTDKGHQEGVKQSLPVREPTERHPRRHVTLYDVVAGRATTYNDLARRTAGLPSQVQESARSPPYWSRAALDPGEYLFSLRGAPERFVEHDVYRAHQWDLPEHGHRILPDSDLLKAIHRYASHFYTLSGTGTPKETRNWPHSFTGGGGPDLRSMDETALLAFGILVEEASREALGQTGDLVFTEGEELFPTVQVAVKDVPAELPRYVGVGDADYGPTVLERRPFKRRRTEPDSPDNDSR